MKVIVTDRAKKDLSKLNQDIRERIFKALLKLRFMLSEYFIEEKFILKRLR